MAKTPENLSAAQQTAFLGDQKRPKRRKKAKSKLPEWVLINTPTKSTDNPVLVQVAPYEPTPEEVEFTKKYEGRMHEALIEEPEKFLDYTIAKAKAAQEAGENLPLYI